MSGLILIQSDWKFTSDSFGFIWIGISDRVGLIFMYFWTNEIQNVSRIGSDWFTLARIQISVWFGIVLIQSDLIRGFYPNESERIQSKFSIRMNQSQSRHDWFTIYVNQSSDWFELNIRFRSIRVQIDSDSFGLKIYSGFVRNSSDWLGMDSYPKLSIFLRI